MNLDFSTLKPSQRYFAMVQTIIPRPIAWVLTDNGHGSYNLAPFSFFTGICSDPPLLMLSVGKKPSGDEAGQRKDTCINIQERQSFVVHIAGTDQLQALNASAETLDHDVSEVDKLGLATVPFDGFDLPRLKDCSVAFACDLYRIDEIGTTPQAVIYGEIKQAYIADALIDAKKLPRLDVDAKALDPLARLGGSHYSSIGELLQADRPK